jgi:hypothetical protein
MSTPHKSGNPSKHGQRHQTRKHPDKTISSESKSCTPQNNGHRATIVPGYILVVESKVFLHGLAPHIGLIHLQKRALSFPIVDKPKLKFNRDLSMPYQCVRSLEHHNNNKSEMCTIGSHVR